LQFAPADAKAKIAKELAHLVIYKKIKPELPSRTQKNPVPNKGYKK